jgi:hypothetical protein
MRSTTLRVAAVAVALGSLTASALTSHSIFLIPAIAALLFLGTTYSEAGRLAEPLREFLHHTAEVRVWGAPLPVHSGAKVTVTSVKALGAGLHLFLRVGPSGASTHLKVAQPGRAQFAPHRLTIESAAYVQWAGKRLPRIEGAAALIISLEPSSGEPPASVS